MLARLVAPCCSPFAVIARIWPAIVAAACLSCEGQHEPARLTILVRDSATGNALNGALITWSRVGSAPLESDRRATDSLGQVTVELERGHYDFRIRMVGFNAASATREVRAGRASWQVLLGYAPLIIDEDCFSLECEPSTPPPGTDRVPAPRRPDSGPGGSDRLPNKLMKLAGAGGVSGRPR